MEAEIRRVNFFNEQFLQEQEFQDEQVYHQHLHRRLNFMLFDGSGVIQVEMSDLTVDPENPPADKRFRVLAGAAVSRRTDLAEGREIVLRQDTDLIDLAVDGPFLLDGPLGAGDTAIVTIHFEQAQILALNLANNQQAVYRIEEQAIVRVHNGAITTSPPDGEQYIILGEIDFDTMAVDPAMRQQARIRSALVGGGGGAALVSIAIVPPNPTVDEGSTVTLQAIGTFSDATTQTLTSGDGLTWSSDDPAIAAFTGGFGELEGISAGSTTVTATLGAISQTANVTVQAPGIPVIDSFSPAVVSVGDTLTVNGQNFASPMTVNFASSSGPRESVIAVVINGTLATATVPGPPAQSGRFTVTVNGIESAESPLPALIILP